MSATFPSCQQGDTVKGICEARTDTPDLNQLMIKRPFQQGLGEGSLGATSLQTRTQQILAVDRIPCSHCHLSFESIETIEYSEQRAMSSLEIFGPSRVAFVVGSKSGISRAIASDHAFHFAGNHA